MQPYHDHDCHQVLEAKSHFKQWEWPFPIITYKGHQAQWDHFCSNCLMSLIQLKSFLSRKSRTFIVFQDIFVFGGDFWLENETF
jgi:hypothetical protein